jgi:CBS domain-containing protein
MGVAMNATMKAEALPRLILGAQTATDLMTPNPVSIQADASLKEAVAFLTDKGFSAAPVIDEAGRPVGVLSRADILVHDREKVEYVPTAAECWEKDDWNERSGERLGNDFQVENVDRTRVSDVMTPIVFSVTPKASAGKVVADMLGLKIHRLFVVDDVGILIGVISALDVLRHLLPEQSSASDLAPVPLGNRSASFAFEPW